MVGSGLCSHRLVEFYLHENTLIFPIIMKDHSVFRTHGREVRLLPEAGGGLIAWLHSDISNNYERQRAASAHGQVAVYFYGYSVFRINGGEGPLNSQANEGPLAWEHSDITNNYERLFCVQDHGREVYLDGYSVFRINGGQQPLLPQAGGGLIAWVHSYISNNYERLFCVQDPWRRAAAAPIGWWKSTCMRIPTLS